MAAPSRLQVGLVAQVQEGGEVGGNLEDNVPSFAAVAAVRTAQRNELLPAERNAAGAAGARFYLNFHFIDKAHNSLMIGSVITRQSIDRNRHSIILFSNIAVFAR
jgi:3'-phosphoadenosine 5'-phosphosulfate sulfotransferase